MTVNYPTEFSGFAVQDVKQWDHPKLTSYKPKKFEDRDIDIEIECCGVCGSDLLTAKGGWGGIKCPQVVGHEIIGKVVSKGAKVTTVDIGDRVGLGAQASSCLDCNRCQNGNEQYCPKSVSTYDSKYPDGYISQGGYASHVRAHEHFCFKIPDEISPEEAGPLMCGGLTVYSPLKRHGACKEGAKVGIIGIGGLGHMAIMLAKAMGAEVWAFSRGYSKKDQAVKMGADHFVATGEKDWEKPLFDTFDLILNCAIGLSDLNLDAFLSTLQVDSKFVSVGLPDVEEKYNVSPFTFFSNNSHLSSSCLGSRQEALELLDVAVKNDIRPWIEKVPISEDGCHEAMSRAWNGDVRYRFVLTDFHKCFGTGK